MLRKIRKGRACMLYNNLSGYLKGKYGKRLKKICVDGGFSCPNRDGKVGFGGCIYCSERVAQILRDKAVNDELIKEVYQVLTTAEFARYAPTTDHAMQDMYDTTTRLINALEDQKL